MPVVDIAGVIIAVTAILAVFGLPLLFVLALVWLLVRGSSKSREQRQLSAQEARTMQEIHQGLQAMERRIENLEALLADKERQPPEDAALR